MVILSTLAIVAGGLLVSVPVVWFLYQITKWTGDIVNSLVILALVSMGIVAVCAIAPGDFITLAGAALVVVVVLGGFSLYRRQSIEESRHWGDEHQAFVIAQQQDVARHVAESLRDFPWQNKNDLLQYWAYTPSAWRPDQGQLEAAIEAAGTTMRWTAADLQRWPGIGEWMHQAAEAAPMAWLVSQEAEVNDYESTR